MFKKIVMVHRFNKKTGKIHIEGVTLSSKKKWAVLVAVKTVELPSSLVMHGLMQKVGAAMSK